MGKEGYYGVTDRTWSIHLSRGKVSMTLRTEGEISETVMACLNAALSAMESLAMELDRDAHSECAD